MAADSRRSIMKVQELMTIDVESCTPEARLVDAVMIMARRDCGIVPVVRMPSRRVVGVVTDRDICMTLVNHGWRPDELRVSDVMTSRVWSVHPEDDVSAALALMEQEEVRRLPVVDAAGALRGILSINDLVRAAGGDARRTRNALGILSVVRALKRICRHRTAPPRSTPEAETVATLVPA